jgi:hypothetical protein
VGIKLAALIPFLFTGLSFLALKALVFGKIALLVAGIAAYDRYFGSNKLLVSSFFDKNIPDWYNAAGNWNTAEYQHAGYKSLDDVDAKIDAHNLAYSAHTSS